MRTFHVGVLTLTAWTIVACGAPDQPVEQSSAPAAPAVEPEAMSLLGEALYAREDTADAIATADAALAVQPDDIDRLLAAAAARAEAWRYREAIELYTHGMGMAPGDWRLYRFRGHRYISTRQFPEAVADLERAVTLAPSSMDASYHLGLAYFLQGRFDQAAREYERCQAQARDADAQTLAAAAAQTEGLRSCARIATDRATLVSVTDWHYRALRRTGRAAEAAALLARIEPGWDMPVNSSYYKNLLFYKGLLSAEQVLAGSDPNERLETVGFGVANWMLAEGDTVGADSLLRRIVRDPHWPGFGRIAAEVELARRGLR